MRPVWPLGQRKGKGRVPECEILVGKRPRSHLPAVGLDFRLFGHLGRVIDVQRQLDGS